MNTLKSIWRDFTNASLLEKLVMMHLLVGFGFLAYAIYYKIWPPTEWVTSLAVLMGVFVYIQQSVILNKQYKVSLLSARKVAREKIMEAINCFNNPESNIMERTAKLNEATKEADIYFSGGTISQKLICLFELTLKWHEMRGYVDGQQMADFVAPKVETDERLETFHKQNSLVLEIYSECRSHMHFD